MNVARANRDRTGYNQNTAVGTPIFSAGDIGGGFPNLNARSTGGPGSTLVPEAVEAARAAADIIKDLKGA